MKYTGPQLMTLLEIKHIRDGKCIWEEYNIPNTWHKEGQEFILANNFDLDYGVEVPENYYMGLDRRSTLSVDQTMASITGEPTTDGYARQSFSSTSGFSIGTNDSDTVIAQTGIATFSATIGDWGPVKNAFLTTRIDNDGHLIASATLSGERIVLAGDSITVRISLSMAGCS